MTADARTALLLLATATLALTGCTGSLDARALDRICRSRLAAGPACELSGVGAIVAGVTDDAYGFELTDGSVIIHLLAVTDLRVAGPVDLSLLVVARDPGTPLDVTLDWSSCPRDCPSNVTIPPTLLPTEYAWVTVASGLRGATPDAEIPFEAAMTFTAANTAIADLRVAPTELR
ncbi:MAG: hypothetical protein ABJE95_27045 [Byssovorax sp.]